LLTRVLDGIAPVCYVLIHTKTCPAKSTSIGMRHRIQLSLGFGFDLASEVLVLVSVLLEQYLKVLVLVLPIRSWSWSCHNGLVDITGLHHSLPGSSANLTPKPKMPSINVSKTEKKISKYACSSLYIYFIYLSHAQPLQLSVVNIDLGQYNCLLYQQCDLVVDRQTVYCQGVGSNAFRVITDRTYQTVCSVVTSIITHPLNYPRRETCPRSMSLIGYSVLKFPSYRSHLWRYLRSCITLNSNNYLWRYTCDFAACGFAVCARGYDFRYHCTISK